MIGQVTSLVERSIRQLLVDNFAGAAAARLEQLAAEVALESARVH